MSQRLRFNADDASLSGSAAALDHVPLARAPNIVSFLPQRRFDIPRDSQRSTEPSCIKARVHA